MRSLLLGVSIVLAGWVWGPSARADKADRHLPTTMPALKGSAIEAELGDPRTEPVDRGFRLNSTGASGSVSWEVKDLQPEMGRWFRFRIRAIAQDNFTVENDALYMRVEFFKDKGINPLDQVTKSIFDRVLQDRKDLADPETARNLGQATWRWYGFNFRTPFPEIDTLRLTAGFENGAGKGSKTEFLISEIQLDAIPDPADYSRPVNNGATKEPPAMVSLVHIGGRWYFDPKGGSKDIPKQFDYTNSDQLYYLADRLEAPFENNMSAWLRKGYKDRTGKVVEQDQFVPDNVVVSFTDKHLVMKSKDLPNHPTASFPDRSGLLDGNPNYIQEQQFTWYIPLEPKVNPNHIAMDAENKNRALPGGAIGVAINGIIFHNPFDELVYKDAIWRIDRCCGHPSPLQTYHYHKYPVCINTPWDDDGKQHSPLLGFAFDGFPIYGPYEAAGELAKDSKSHPLNEFNLHEDELRGPHYHVTPGQFPHLIGGFWGELEMLDRNRRGPPPRRQPNAAQN